MFRRICRLVALVTLSASPASGQPLHDTSYVFDCAAAQRDTLTHLKALIALDTQNPPGNEISSLGWAAEYLYRVLLYVGLPR